MKHVELVGMVVSRAGASGIAVKKAIEGLLERDFLERDEGER